jgi:kynurenine formamidase
MGKYAVLETRDGFERFVTERRNWGRWGTNDQLGTVNLISPEKRREAAALVTAGISVGLARPLATEPRPDNPKPALQYLVKNIRPGRGGDGSSVDFYGFHYHGVATTHIDALCHTFGGGGMWNGRDASVEISHDGVHYGGIQAMRDGIFTSGVLLDVAAHRGTYVTKDSPATGDELVEVAEATSSVPDPGDAVVIHAGREMWSRDHGPWGAKDGKGVPSRAGIAPSCIGPLRDWDVSAVIWDMCDAEPNSLGLTFGAHTAIHAFGLTLVDNANVEGLAATCRELGRTRFLITVAPLVVNGGTGSPVNPVAVL